MNQFQHKQRETRTQNSGNWYVEPTRTKILKKIRKRNTNRIKGAKHRMMTQWSNAYDEHHKHQQIVITICERRQREIRPRDPEQIPYVMADYWISGIHKKDVIQNVRAIKEETRYCCWSRRIHSGLTDSSYDDPVSKHNKEEREWVKDFTNWYLERICTKIVMIRQRDTNRISGAKHRIMNQMIKRKRWTP